LTIGQVTYNYLPIIGGQEIYIKKLIEVLASNSISSHIFQPNKLSINKVDPNVTRVFYLPLIGKIIKEWNWYLFNLFLFFYKKKIASCNLIITHYAFHSLPVWNLKDRVIVLSHGIEWNIDKQTINDRIHEFIAKKAFDRFTIVANDTHYFRHLGLDISPAKGFFTEVASGKWFIPNCVDHLIFKKTQGIDELKSKKIILVPRQITEDRGIDLAIHAFSIFQKQNPGFHLYIVGGPLSGKYYKYCKNLINSIEINDKVIFAGPIAYESMPDIYSSSVMTLIPTLRREGTSLSALESMACGTPTISTNVAGLQDLPTVKANADPIDLANKMTYCLSNHSAISNQQYYDVISTFNIKNWNSAWLRVITSLLSKK